MVGVTLTATAVEVLVWHETTRGFPSSGVLMSPLLLGKTKANDRRDSWINGT
ncbi:hypothetical protein HAL1_15051 [Halomonas sp. HAL1]|nr:hypothetical protein HAL1_15051 [Halomonas sp. HAL1]